MLLHEVHAPRQLEEDFRLEFSTTQNNEFESYGHQIHLCFLLRLVAFGCT